MKKYHNSLMLFIAFFIIFEGVVIYYADFLKRPYWGDESHFVETIHSFGEEISIQRIKNYKEVTPPFVYIVYALWGRIFGWEIYKLRILSVIIAFLVYFLFHQLLFMIFNDLKTSLLTTLFLMVNPYMVGTSVFVFTDMLTIFFLLGCCFAIIRHNSILFLISSSCALLCRQYSIFLIGAAGLYYLNKFLIEKKHSELYMMISSVVSILPLLSLFFLWGGIAPAYGLQYWNPENKFYYHPDYLTVYICMIFVYLFPFIILKWKYFYNNLKVLIGCFVAGGYYLLFPIAPSKVTLEQTDFVTVGLIHRFIKLFIKNHWVEHTIFFVFFCLVLPVIYFLVKDCYTKWKNKELHFPLFLDLSILSFLIIMPFSYQNWEKYLLPLIPLLSIRILLIKDSDGKLPEER
ncbi:ArnT family glycosyltransferase [Candidatus Latescibacterota bacterium]